MEGLILVLIGVLLFTHAWYVLGLYIDGRTMGLIVALLAVGIAASVSGNLAPIMVPAKVGLAANPALMAIQVYAILWAVYGGAVAAHGLWNFEERAIGFHSAFLFAASIIYLIAFPVGAFTKDQASTESVLVLSVSALVLGLLSAMVFFNLAIPFRGLRPVTGWFLLVGSVLVALLGFGVLFRLIG